MANRSTAPGARTPFYRLISLLSARLDMLRESGRETTEPALCVWCCTSRRIPQANLVLHSIVSMTATLWVRPGNNVALKGNALGFDIPFVGSYQATLSADGHLEGKWSYDTTTVFTRTTAAAAPRADSGQTTSSAGGSQGDPRSGTEAGLERGLLSKPTGGGLVIGVLDHGERRIFTYGTARPDSIFEIGLITKTFTGLILAQMVVRKKVSLNGRSRSTTPGLYRPTQHA